MSPPKDLSALHEQAHYKCGKVVQSTDTFTKYYLCGLQPSDLQRAFDQFSYKWEPHACVLPRFGAKFEKLVEMFLQQAEGFKFVFVGDSFSQEQFVSLRCLLGEHVPQHQDETMGSFITSNGIEFTMFPSAYLVNKTTFEVMVPGRSPLSADGMQETRDNARSPYMDDDNLKRDVILSTFEDPFTWETYEVPADVNSYAHIVNGRDTVLVLNTGAHWHGNMEGYSIMVKNVLSYWQRNFRGRRIFYRSSSHGHANCMGASEPLSSEPGKEQVYHFNWRLLQHYNALWKQEIAQLEDDRFIYIDVHPMSEHRPDSHFMGATHDCFHLCLPGVIDYWNVLLMSFIVYGK